MIIQLHAVSIQGLDGVIIDVEVDTQRTSNPAFSIVGLGDTAIQESRDRIRPAIKNSGFTYPSGKKITANLAPADTKKRGPSFDLSIALGIIGTEHELDGEILRRSIFLGELALDGRLRPLTGILPAVLTAKKAGFTRVFIPTENCEEALLVEGIDIIGLASLSEAVEYLTGSRQMVALERKETEISDQIFMGPDFADVIGQDSAKRALLIAAAGGHNILLQGPPGSGKTMLAQAFGGILPPLTFDEMIAVSRVYSVAGLLSKSQPIIRDRPFRKVHHTASIMSIVGGGRDARPGEISLAHKGVLFMDEFLEFDGKLLETLRQPLEDGEIVINRVHGSYKYPAKFLLVGAYNPTPCGYPEGDPQCTDSPAEIERYRSKLSGPILDRIDLFVSVPRVKVEDFEKFTGERTTSLHMREKVRSARSIQLTRFSGESITANAEMSNTLIEKYCVLSSETDQFLKQAVQRLDLSTRVYFRLLRLARTIADIDGSETIEKAHLAEALSYRERRG